MENVNRENTFDSRLELSLKDEEENDRTIQRTIHVK